MSFFNPQNPGIGGLNELTDAEQLFVQNLTNLSYQDGDILYYDSGNLQRLAVGTDTHVLTLVSGLPSWQAPSVGASISGTPSTGQYAKWTNSTTIEGVNISTVISDLGAQITSNLSTNVTTDGASNTKYPSVKAIKDYTDGLVAGLLDYRGAYDASVNTFPATGGSGTAGAIMKGDMFIISVAGVLNSVAVQVGDSIISSIDTPGQTASNWNILNSNISYVPEDVANKENTTIDTNTTKYPTINLLKTGLDLKSNIDNPTFTTRINTPDLRATSSGGFLLEASNGTDIGLLGSGNTANITWYGSHNFDTATQDTIAGFTGSGKTLGSLSTSTYPSLTELSYVKGVTSSIQTQLGTKIEAGTTNTLTNKRITARVTTITSHATPTINTDDCDAVTITALAEAITSMTTNLSGTPTNFQKLIFRIKDNGTARAITWGASFQSGSVTLPTTTTLGKTLMVGLIYDSVDSKWTCEATGSRA